MKESPSDLAAEAAPASGSKVRLNRTGALALAGILGGLGAVAASLALVRPALLELACRQLLDRVSSFSIWGVLEYVAVLVAVLAVEVIALGWNRSALRRLLRPSRSARTDLTVAAVHIVGWAPVVSAAITCGTTWGVSQFSHSYLSLDFVRRMGPLWVQALLVFLATDFMDYWYHRFSHEVEFLWQAHKYHHAATELNILTGTRVHALEEAFHQILAAVPLALLGTPAELYFAVRIGKRVIDLFQHSMVPWSYGWIGRWFIYSPVGHRVHHSPLREHWDLNYGNILVVWDRMFGTWYRGSSVNASVDVSDNPYNASSVILEYFHCVGLYAESFFDSLKSGSWRAVHRRPISEPD